MKINGRSQDEKPRQKQDSAGVSPPDHQSTDKPDQRLLHQDKTKTRLLTRISSWKKSQIYIWTFHLFSDQGRKSQEILEEVLSTNLES